MADTQMRITNMPESGSPNRVAFELMVRISAAESAKNQSPPEKPREYYLELYKECRALVY